jgi:hypothetical protein
MTSEPAAAANINATGCAFVDYRVPVGTSVTFSLPSGCDLATSFIAGGNPSFSSRIAVGPTTVVVGIDGPSDWADMYFTSTAPLDEVYVFACGVDTGFDYSNPASQYSLVDYCPTSPGPPDVLQQVVSPAAGCATFADASLNWGGAGSGGWGSSWAQWANDGKGGAVCTRTLRFDATLRHYVVQA